MTTKQRVTVITVLALGAILWAGCARAPAPGEPLRGLTAGERARFDAGREVFDREFEPGTGLGPLFNSVSCAECHEEPATGGFGDELEVHATALLDDGRCDALLDAGGPVYQLNVTPALHDALGIDAEPIPDRATGQGRRSTPSILGFGLLDAVPDKAILALADADDRDGDGISGRPNRFADGRLGRFGRKAFVPTLREFNDGAFPLEQGVTTAAQPAEETVAGRPLPDGVDSTPDPEIGADDLSAADAFVRFLAPPAARHGWLLGITGGRIFRSIGCAACHTPKLHTGDGPVAVLRHRTVGAYTDLLLHDMGPELADICLGLATPSEFRTEPLMGLGLRERFLHDGRAASVEEAIRLHAGEATRSRQRFEALGAAERRTLLEFLGRL